MTDQATVARANACHCEAKKHAYRQTQDGVVVSFVLHPQDVPDGLALSSLGTRYMLALVEIGDDEAPKKIEAPRAEGGNATRGAKTTVRSWSQVSLSNQAGIRCDEPLFRAFLREAKGFNTKDADGVAAAVREICCVSSRSDIKTDTDAGERWLRLENQYRAWQAAERAGA